MEELKCVCGKTAKRVNDIKYKGLKFNGWRCKCGQEMVDPYQANLYLKFEKLKKEGKTSVRARRVGNTLVVSIPKILRTLFGIKEGADLDFKLDKKGIIIECD
ncbi:MAG: hypothetical protein COS08_07430 [Euryarchaeota archaeon CG01_land_8_20_14_3_00_38_12]|nr:MAG: hypothetical protein COS08_07430 [Euryarchaeota archaeon CG01_land_8_20_14_3_00_38_12]